jgi:hypothetical protein
VRPEFVDEYACRVSRDSDGRVVFLLLNEDVDHGEKDAAEKDGRTSGQGLVPSLAHKRH